MAVTIRPAVAADAALIHGFIRALAEYEKLEAEMRATPADIARDLFGPDPRAFCDIAEADGAPVGFALWFYSYSTFEGQHGIYLEDLFVVPEARGLGAGLALMRNLAGRCVEESLARFEWAVLDWNASSIDFYDRLGAAVMDGWMVRRLTGEALRRLARP